MTVLLLVQDANNLASPCAAAAAAADSTAAAASQPGSATNTPAAYATKGWAAWANFLDRLLLLLLLLAG
jgi:hypothetical protein